ncbi:hypothetical protein E1B28_010368 [Marasmius oreades]|uniref:Uncharacterized protein n=1 Tax=Marasmius oreades TaxID=181124 RepID=A0A9P7UTK2_9AGAR|nr:uncharacterized protein E1B28_010368 [Marasmius oreades]KAG7091324.1 hypothetical protein E1B28_010368 [Marasmius oreades]
MALAGENNWTAALKSVCTRFVPTVEMILSRSMLALMTLMLLSTCFNPKRLHTLLLSDPPQETHSRLDPDWAVLYTSGFAYSVVAGVATAEGYSCYSLVCVFVSATMLLLLCLVTPPYTLPSMSSTLIVSATPHLLTHWIVRGHWKRFEVHVNINDVQDWVRTITGQARQGQL